MITALTRTPAFSTRRVRRCYGSLTRRVVDFMAQNKSSEPGELRKRVSLWQAHLSLPSSQQAVTRRRCPSGQLLGDEAWVEGEVEVFWADNRTLPHYFPEQDPMRDAFCQAIRDHFKPHMSIWEGGSGSLDLCIWLYHDLLAQGQEPLSLIGSDINVRALRRGLGLVNHLSLEDKISALGSRVEQFPQTQWITEQSLIVYKDLLAVLPSNGVKSMLAHLGSLLSRGAVAVFNLPIASGPYFAVHLDQHLRGRTEAITSYPTGATRPDFVTFRQASKVGERAAYLRTFFVEDRLPDLLEFYGLSSLRSPSTVDQFPRGVLESHRLVIVSDKQA